MTRQKELKKQKEQLLVIRKSITDSLEAHSNLEGTEEYDPVYMEDGLNHLDRIDARIKAIEEEELSFKMRNLGKKVIDAVTDVKFLTTMAVVAFNLYNSALDRKFGMMLLEIENEGGIVNQRKFGFKDLIRHKEIKAI